jgi:D-alanyl-D-alanine carboxypeptidase
MQTNHPFTLKNIDMYTRLFFLSIILLISFSHFSQGQSFNTSKCSNATDPAGNHPKAAILQSAINQLVETSVPGAVAAISDANGTWIGTAGLAKLEDATPMGTCHLHYLQSIAKTYLAVVIMQLYEAGKIDLDARATNYLPEEQSRRIPGIEKVTVRMLLSHTSGLPEYNYRPTYITRLLQNPSRLFSPAEYIDYVEKAKPVFEAGTKYLYSNFGYVVLSLIADQVTGDHAAYMREHVFAKLGLQHTYYRIDQGNTYDQKLVNSYWDRHSNGSVENISVLQNSNVASMAGDDGVITTPEEAILFLKGLMDGKLVKPETLAMMMEWTKDSKGKPRYGLGLTYATMANEKAIGHSGGGLGAGAELYYFPDKKVYMFLAINLGTVTSSPIHDRAEKVLNDLHAAYVQ